MTDRLDRLAANALTAQVYPPVLGIDPGSMHTGICLRVGTGAVEAATVDNEGDPTNHLTMGLNARRVVEIAHELVRRNRDRLTEIAAGRGLVDPPKVQIAVEHLVQPSGKRVKGSQEAVSPTILKDLPGAGVVLGVVYEHWRQSIPVPPLGWVTLPDGSRVKGWDAVGEVKELAPANLRSHTRAGWLKPQPGHQKREHQRSAWAIAGAAHVLTAPPLRDQAAAAARHAAAQRPSADPERLVPTLRRSVAQTGSWDLLTRLPDLARTVVAASTRDRTAGDQAAAAVEQYLTEVEEGDGHDG